MGAIRMGKKAATAAARPQHEHFLVREQALGSLLGVAEGAAAARPVVDRRPNIEPAELEHQELWQRSRVGVVSISGDGKYLEESLEAIASESERILGRDLVSRDIEYFEDGE